MTQKGGIRVLRERRGYPVGFVVFLTLLLVVSVVGFAVSDVLRRMGPPKLGEAIAYSPIVTDRDGRLLRPFATKDG
jgi:membrane carboxypeptidase/penicillin-binding protein PbpC